MKRPTDVSSRYAREAQEAARVEGEVALRNADRAVCERAGLARRVVSFSLFGDEPGYCESAILNAQCLAQFYPGWEMWLFHDGTVPPQVLARLSALSVHLADARAWGMGHWPGTFWRFAAVKIPNASYVIFRDADSVFCERERSLVAAWLESGKPFHVIRDWYSHTDLVLAGLWGAYAPLLAAMPAWIEDYIASRAPHPTHADQHFLAESVWPRIRGFTLVHDSIHRLDGVVAFAPPETDESGKHSLGGYLVKQLQFTFHDDSSGRYTITMLDQARLPVFSYERCIREGKDAFSLPYTYCDRMASGEWKLVLGKFQSEPKEGTGRAGGTADGT